MEICVFFFFFGWLVHLVWRFWFFYLLLGFFLKYKLVKISFVCFMVCDVLGTYF